MSFEPNHICKNSKCPYGENGEPKHYYACDSCDRKSYRVLACSPECYIEVMKVFCPDMYPTRTDKTKEEVKEIMTAPIEEVERRSVEELSKFSKDVTTLGIEKVVDLINEEIDNKTAKKNKKRKSGGSN